MTNETVKQLIRYSP